MASDLDALLYHSVEQELVLLFAPALQDFLNDMVAIDVLAHFFQAVAEEILNHFKVLWHLYDLQNLLNRSGTMSIFAEVQRILLHRLYDSSELGLIADFSNFLDQVVSEIVVHKFPTVIKIYCVVKNMVKKFLIVFRFGLEKILL